MSCTRRAPAGLGREVSSLVLQKQHKLLARRPQLSCVRCLQGTALQCSHLELTARAPTPGVQAAATRLPGAARYRLISSRWPRCCMLPTLRAYVIDQCSSRGNSLRVTGLVEHLWLLQKAQHGQSGWHCRAACILCAPNAETRALGQQLKDKYEIKADIPGVSKEVRS